MMEYITETTDFQIEEPAVVTIGKFDGRHRGHQKLLKQMLEVKAERGLKTAVFTFDMTPGSLVEGKKQTVITTNLERRNNLERIGIDYLVEYPFTKETARMAPEDFVRDILVSRMHARVIVVGTDCSLAIRGPAMRTASKNGRRNTGTSSSSFTRNRMTTGISAVRMCGKNWMPEISRRRTSFSASRMPSTEPWCTEIISGEASWDFQRPTFCRRLKNICRHLAFTCQRSM